MAHLRLQLQNSIPWKQINVVTSVAIFFVYFQTLKISWGKKERRILQTSTNHFFKETRNGKPLCCVAHTEE